MITHMILTHVVLDNNLTLQLKDFIKVEITDQKQPASLVGAESCTVLNDKCSRWQFIMAATIAPFPMD